MLQWHKNEQYYSELFLYNIAELIDRASFLVASACCCASVYKQLTLSACSQSIDNAETMTYMHIMEASLWQYLFLSLYYVCKQLALVFVARVNRAAQFSCSFLHVLHQPTSFLTTANGSNTDE